MWFMYDPYGNLLFCVDELYVSVVYRFIHNNPKCYVAKEKNSDT